MKSFKAWMKERENRLCFDYDWIDALGGFAPVVVGALAVSTAWMVFAGSVTISG